MLAATVLAVGAIFVELDRRRGLERFLPPNVVSRVIAGDALRLQGERHVATILFADLRGSTALAERLEPEAVSVRSQYAVRRCRSRSSRSPEPRNGMSIPSAAVSEPPRYRHNRDPAVGGQRGSHGPGPH